MLPSRAIPSWVHTHVHPENPAGSLGFLGVQLGYISWVEKYYRIPSWRPYFMGLPAGFKKLLSSRQRGVLPRMSWTGWIFPRS
jgi:hypothetical protein